jgi:hypothetical protein
VINRDEVVATMFLLADIRAELEEIRQLLGGDDEEEAEADE